MRMVFPTNMTGRFLDDLASEMNTFVESVISDDSRSSALAYAPRMDVIQTENSFVAYLDLPGVAPDQVSIDMQEDQVIVSGDRSPVQLDENSRSHRAECPTGAFRRAIMLPKNVDKDAIDADYEHGVLRITMPKQADENKSRRIVVSPRNAKETQDSVSAN